MQSANQTGRQRMMSPWRNARCGVRWGVDGRKGDRALSGSGEPVQASSEFGTSSNLRRIQAGSAMIGRCSVSLDRKLSANQCYSDRSVKAWGNNREEGRLRVERAARRLSTRTMGTARMRGSKEERGRSG